MQGQLFTQDFLTRGVCETPAWQAQSPDAIAQFGEKVRRFFRGLSAESTLNEAQTEALVIHKLLGVLGWDEDFLPQVNSDAKGRESVPDLLLFADPRRKALAIAESRDDRRYRHGLAIVEAKRWRRPLDRGDLSEVTDPDAPSSQMLRYLSRVDVASDRAIKWGILSNGAVWRLYWQDARSRAEDFFELDLGHAAGVAGCVGEADDFSSDHSLRLFWLFFGRTAFVPQTWDSAGRTLHAYALNEARQYEEKVSQDLGQRVFTDIFPQLADALARGDHLNAQTESVGYGQFTRQRYTRAYLDEVREATLVLLYRLLFLFYAEDRNLLPVRDPRYAPYSVRRIREEVRDKIETGAVFSSTMSRIWLALRGAFILIDKGDDEIGMPAYNGGLFAWERSPLLNRTHVPDKVMAPIMDALSRRTEDLLHGWINYRDLSVSHLGGIYERLLEYSLEHEVQAKDDYKDKPEINRVVARPASFARKVSGSYYTHHDLVRLILRESVGLLAQERVKQFDEHLGKIKKASLNPSDWERLDTLDPASQILELKICDPALGSGHFLVALVDDLADRVLEAINWATHEVGLKPWAAHLAEAGRPWVSPVVARIAAIRTSIKTAAREHHWSVSEAQLDDRHIVRRMILKKSIFGVDKNPMAVELAKTSLWLHTFTVGAPLSFLDHHLKVGDSLHGERLYAVQRDLQALGALLLQGEFDRLALASRNITQVADLTDVDIAEAALSKQLAQQATEQMAPIHAMLDFWRALRWMVPGWPVDNMQKLGRLLAKSATAEGNPVLDGLVRLLDTNHNLVTALGAGKLPGRDAATLAANTLMEQARQLAQRETFFHWWTSFPTVFGTDGQGGFDAIIGNPPWDRIKLQEVEWFSERSRDIAGQTRAADRQRLIQQLERSNAPLWADYALARQRAEDNARVLGNGKLGCGDYPLLGGGDVNLYSLFVERSQALVAPSGLVALLTPSGIAADKGASAFFRSIATTGRLGALFDFENRKGLFPDVDSRFKFCAMVFGGAQRRFDQTRCAFYLHSLDQLDAQPERTLTLSAQDFERVNPNTGAAPIFRSRRDADITLRLYAQHPVLVRHGEHRTSTGQSADVKAWPVKYQTMFHMTNDSHLFLKADELAAKGFTPGPLNRWVDAVGQMALPLYVGRMIHQYDHRAAGVEVNDENLKVASLSAKVGYSAKQQLDHYPTPQYWIRQENISVEHRRAWSLAFRDIARATDARTFIASLIPGSAAGNKLPMLTIDETGSVNAAHAYPLLLANLNSMAFDFVTRKKVQSTSVNWFIVEQLPVIAPDRFEQPLPKRFVQAMRNARLMNGHHEHPSVADFVIPQVLALSYTAHDLAPFAQDLGYVDAQGQVLPPFVWDETERRQRMAGLDAVFFWLYGLDLDDARYVLDSFVIVREADIKATGSYRTQADILALMDLLDKD